MLVVSYYTGDGNYAAYAAKLRASCEKFGIEHQIEQLPSGGDWVRNLGFKPRFVYDKLLKNKKSVVWMDADCEVMQYPALLDDDQYDLMIYNWYAEANPGARFHDATRLGPASGVFRVKYGAPMLQFLHAWMQQCQKLPRMRDDLLLGHVYSNWKGPKLRTFWLPKAYNRMDSHWPEVEPVINHVYTDGTIFAAGAGDAPLEKGLPVQATDPMAPREG
ncbi:MAG TPA: hypothetical protein VD997_16135 [Phycisphaerales bacterium]|nr:hypothetical protein [Phycisphaerales bacterium]